MIQRKMDEFKKIKWKCQDCGWHWMTTEGASPDGMGDPPEHGNCTAGWTMNAMAFCDECDQDLGWGDSLCKHFLGLGENK